MASRFLRWGRAYSSESIASLCSRASAHVWHSTGLKLFSSSCCVEPLVSLLGSEVSHPERSRKSGSSSFSSRVGFIGLGNMGAHMAANLLKAGHHLTVHDRNEKVMRPFAGKGASTALNPRDVAHASDVVITMLPSSPQAEEVYVGPNGLLDPNDAVHPSLLIDASTIDPHMCRLLASKVATCKLASNSRDIGAGQAPVMLDAPVSGGVVGAQAATLTFMVGGSQEALMAAQPLLQAMGKRVVHCGGAGNGAAAKVCNNLALAISMAGVSEALALGQQLGIDARTLSNIFNSSSARCWSSDTYNPVPGVMVGCTCLTQLSRGVFLPAHGQRLGTRIGSSTGIRFTIASSFASLQYERYMVLCKNGQGDLDFSSIFSHYYKGAPEQVAADTTPEAS